MVAVITALQSSKQRFAGHGMDGFQGAAQTKAPSFSPAIRSRLFLTPRRFPHCCRYHCSRRRHFRLVSCTLGRGAIAARPLALPHHAVTDSAKHSEHRAVTISPLATCRFSSLALKPLARRQLLPSLPNSSQVLLFSLTRRLIRV